MGLLIFGSILSGIAFCEIFMLILEKIRECQERKVEIKRLEEQLWCYKTIHDIEQQRISKLKKTKEKESK